MYSVTICSDDGVLAGNIEYAYAPIGTMCYIARIWDVRRIVGRGGEGAVLIEAKSFGNGTGAEDWMLDKLECPLFTLLSK